MTDYAVEPLSQVDIADVVHLVAARGSEAFVAFDKGGEVIGVEVEVVGS